MEPITNATVYLVDDDASVREALAWLLRSRRLPSESFDSAEAFDAMLQKRPPQRQPCCLLLDVRMPGMSGLELQQLLRSRQCALPIVFLTGHGDVELAVQAMKHGAFDFLEKPFKDQRLLDVVAAALRQRESSLQSEERTRQASARLQQLTPREAEVALLVARGLPNKLVARELDISEKTVHIHRQHVMEKTGLGSAAELARLILQVDPQGLD